MLGGFFTLRTAMNALYDRGRQAFLEGGIAWLTDNIKAILVSAAYAPQLAVDQFLSDIPPLDILATSADLSSKGSVAGVASAADVTFPTVSGPPAVAIVLYKDTGSTSTSQLIAYIDTGIGLPVVLSGGDILIRWDVGPNKIFKL